MALLCCLWVGWWLLCCCEGQTQKLLSAPSLTLEKNQSTQKMVSNQFVLPGIYNSKLTDQNSRFMFMLGVLYMKCMKSCVVLMRIWSPLYRMERYHHVPCERRKTEERHKLIKHHLSNKMGGGVRAHSSFQNYTGDQVCFVTLLHCDFLLYFCGTLEIGKAGVESSRRHTEKGWGWELTQYHCDKNKSRCTGSCCLNSWPAVPQMSTSKLYFWGFNTFIWGG